ncbi:MAG: accessory gene regulator B family protein [Anaerocolumna sp.]
MANRVAVKIADFLCKNNTIRYEDKDIYIYGFEIFFSNLINFTIVVVLGYFFNCFYQAMLFYIAFVITRSYSGGYHASTYLKCNLTFASVFLVTMFISRLLLPTISLVYLLVFMAIYIGCILEYAPIENGNKKLLDSDKIKYRKISIVISICWTIIVLVLYFFAKEYAATLTFTLVMVAMLMLIEVNKRKELY